MIGEVYFIQSERGPIKIGFTTDIVKRMARLQAGMPELISVVARVPGDRRTEFFLHQRFRSSHLIGEWFSPSDELLAFIRDVAVRGIDALPAEYRPEPEYAGESIESDDLKEECRDYCVSIAGHRVGSEKISDLITRVSMITGIPHRTIRVFWYREQGSVHASHYLRLREVFEAREAMRLTKLLSTNVVPIRKALGDVDSSVD